MGQKTNPNILRLGASKQWNIKNIEKKNQEIAFYSFKSTEIKQFIEKNFRDNGLIVVKCKVYYSDSGLLHIFLLYNTSPDVSFFITSSDKIYSKLNFNNSIKNYKFCTNSNFFKSKILSKLLNSLHAFTLNKTNIVLTMSQINKELADLKKIKLFKENVIELRRFEDNKFYQRGLQTVFLAAQETNSASFLAKFIAYELSKIKKHNVFLRFLKKALIRAKNNLPQAIKIKITGRFNRSRRARHKFIHVGKDVPILTIKNNINYSDQTSFTPNGTFGIKVWVYTPA
jgi:ribosomal protein S3